MPACSGITDAKIAMSSFSQKPIKSEIQNKYNKLWLCSKTEIFKVHYLDL